jgi:beta-lactamase regulating signal transducer with metallopeptidase domain
MMSLNELTNMIAHVLWNVSWQVTILIAVVALASLLFRRAPANFRFGLWCIVLLRLCIPFDLSFPAPINIDTSPATAAYAQWLVSPATAIQNTVMPTFTQPPAAPRKTTLVLIWLGVAAAAACLVLAREWQARRLLRKCRPTARAEAESLAYQLQRKCGIKRAVTLGVFP